MQNSVIYVMNVIWIRSCRVLCSREPTFVSISFAFNVVPPEYNSKEVGVENYEPHAIYICEPRNASLLSFLGLSGVMEIWVSMREPGTEQDGS